MFNFFGSLRNNSADEKGEFPWITLHSNEQLEELEEMSQRVTVVIFKHSTRCGISSMVLRRFEKSTDLRTEMRFYFLDLLRYREVSDAVAARFQVWHQSPQLIVVRNGMAVHDASHSSIQAEQLQRFR